MYLGIFYIFILFLEYLLINIKVHKVKKIAGVPFNIVCVCVYIYIGSRYM